MRNPDEDEPAKRWYGILTHLWQYQPWPGVLDTPAEQLFAFIEWYPTVFDHPKGGIQQPRLFSGLEVVQRRAGSAWHSDPLQPFAAIEPALLTLLPHPNTDENDHFLVVSIDPTE